jgi:hypothetical protein
MAGISQTHILTIKDDAGRVATTTTTVITGDTEVEFNVSVPGSGNHVVDLAVIAANIVGFYIVSDKAVTMTENDDGTPDLTVALAAGVPYVWRTGLGANPISVDITSLKLVKADATAAIVKGSFIVTS